MENTYYQQQINITVEKIILAPVAGYQEQFIRPYDIKVTHDDLIKLENIVERAMHRSSSSINPIELANNINVLEPMSTPIDKSHIIGGWNQERAVFLMTASWVDPYTGSEEVLYLTGYSDYPELNTRTGTVSEKIMLYPNTAILLVKTMTVNGPVLKIKHSFTIEYESDVNKLSIQEDFSFQDERLLLRPYDTLAVINNVMEGYNTLPMESTLKNINTIEREDMIPVNHMTTVINSLLQGSLMNSGFYESDTFVYSKEASKKVRLENIEFFRKEIQELGTTPGLSFPLGWLFKLDPTMTSDRVYAAAYLTGDSMLNALGNGQLVNGDGIFNANLPLILTSDIGENAGDATLESNIAVLVRDAVSSLLARNMLTDIAFTITNAIPGADTIFQPYFAFPAVSGINLVALTEKFKIEFLNLIVPQITRNHNLIVDIDVYSSITGDTKIAVSINGAEKRLYKFPTFADSLYNSLLTNKDIFYKVSQDYKSIVDQTLSAASSAVGDVLTAPINDEYNN